MNKPNLSLVVGNLRKAMKRHSPEILTGIGIAGMILTTVMAVKATPKALLLIEERKYREDMDEYADRLTVIETVKTTWLCYIPAAITAGISIFCLIGASSANVRRNTALAAAYTLSESALREYKEKVVETIGEKKEQAISDAVAKDKIEKNPASNREVIISAKGDTLCYDAISGRYFKSDIEKIRKAVNEINKNLLNDMYISLNDFYYEVGLSNTKLGDDLGWTMNDGFVDISFSSQLSDDGTPCLVMDYRVAPRYDYYK